MVDANKRPAPAEGSDDRTSVAPANDPTIGPSVPRAGNWLTRSMGRVTMRLTGWKFDGSLPDTPKMIVTVAPHTSNWDVFLAITVVWALGMRAHWIGKHTIFKPPFAGLMRWLGGIPVRRDASHGLVEQIVDEFERRDGFVLGIAPEGTRKQVDRWRSGFWHIARTAGITIAPASIDYRRRRIVFGPAFQAGDDYDSDLAELQRWFASQGGGRLRP